MAENQNSNRKNENVRRANRIIQTRSFVLMILMGVVMFVLLFFRLFDLQITRHEELQGKAVNQQTRRTVVTANRGTIYDAGGNILAISSSAETIILSPLERGERHGRSRQLDEGVAGGRAGGDPGQGRLGHPETDGQREVPV